MHEAIDVSLSSSIEQVADINFPCHNGSHLFLYFEFLNFCVFMFAIVYSAIGNLNQERMELLAKLWRVVTNGKHNLWISKCRFNPWWLPT